MKAEEMRAEYSAITCPQKSVGNVSFGEVTVPKIDQGGPSEAVEFIYIDISSVDNKLKRVTEYKTLAVEAAPSRAKQQLKSGDVLVSMTRPNLNAVAIVPPELDGAVGSTGFHVLRATEGTEPRWLYYAVQTKDFISAMSELVQGALYPAVRPKDIRAYEIPHPPLDQQKRIVAEIEKQFSRLDEAVANLKRYKAAVLKAAVEGHLVETEAELAREGRSYETGAQLLQRILETRRSQWKGKSKYKELAAPDTTALPELPKGWVWASVGSLGVVIGGLTKNPKRAALSRKLPYLRVANVYANELRLDEIEEIGVEDNELEKLLVQKDDLLIVEGNGSPDQIGRLAIWDGSISPCVHQNHLIKVRLPAKCSPKWVVSWLLSPEGRNRIRDVASSTSGLFTLSVGKVTALPVPLPPIAEQLRIIGEIERSLSLTKEAEVQVNANLLRAERLRQSTLQNAFAMFPRKSQ